MGWKGKAPIRKDWLEREESLDNPKDSTAVAKGRGLGHLVPVMRMSRFPKMLAYFLHEANTPLVLKWLKLKGFALNSFG